jgi:hypothetical protein
VTAKKCPACKGRRVITWRDHSHQHKPLYWYACPLCEPVSFADSHGWDNLNKERSKYGLEPMERRTKLYE